MKLQELYYLSNAQSTIHTFITGDTGLISMECRLVFNTMGLCLQSAPRPCQFTPFNIVDLYIIWKRDLKLYTQYAYRYLPSEPAHLSKAKYGKVMTWVSIAPKKTRSCSQRPDCGDLVDSVHVKTSVYRYITFKKFVRWHEYSLSTMYAVPSYLDRPTYDRSIERASSEHFE